jgi:hypothetical protein
MDPVLKFAPIVSPAMLVFVAIVGMMRLNDVVSRLYRTLDSIDQGMKNHERRLVRLETHCADLHGKPLTPLEDSGH